MGTVSLPVPEDAMEVDFDAPTSKSVQTPLVSTATVMQVETLSWCRDICRNQDRSKICEIVQVASRVRKVIHADSHLQDIVLTELKKDEAQLRVFDTRIRAMQSVISRMMSKCRTRHLESCDTFSAFFHAFLERDVQMKSKDPEWSDGWRWQLAMSVLSSESRGEHLVDARMHPNGDRRKVR